MESEYLEDSDPICTLRYNNISVDFWRDDIISTFEQGIERLSVGKKEIIDGQISTYIGGDMKLVQLENNDCLGEGTEWKLTLFPVEDSGYKIISLSRDNHGTITLSYYGYSEAKNITVRYNPYNSSKNEIF